MMPEPPLIEKALKRLPIFSQLPDAVLQQLIEQLVTINLAAEERLFRQGDSGTDMFIINNGRVKAILPDEHGREIFLNAYTNGQFIGELALLSQQPRAATVVATEPTTLFKLSRDTFLEIMEGNRELGHHSVENFHHYLRQHYKIQLLKRIEWFADMPQEELTVIANKIHAKSFNRNDILFQRGDTGDAFYIIIQGWVSAFVHSDKGSAIVLNQLGPGEIFGEMAILEDKPRSAGIMALTPLEVLTLERTEFIALLQEHAPIALETLRSLSGKLRFTVNYLEKAIVWSQRIADGDYSMVLDQIKTSQDNVVGAMESEDFRISAFLSAFIQLVQEVKEREDELRSEISALKMRIEIDEEKRAAQVQAITQNPFFTSLREKAQKMRQESNHKEE
ncbi:MAG: cyclic nucleotide-binding domain-containing protein [Chloroflexota bacterium]